MTFWFWPPAVRTSENEILVSLWKILLPLQLINPVKVLPISVTSAYGLTSRAIMSDTIAAFLVLAVSCYLLFAIWIEFFVSISLTTPY